MSKELEALERVDDYVDKDYDYCQKGDYSKDYKLIKQALQRLEAIDNANPSEAMECLKSLDIQVRFMGILDVPSWEKYLPTIKQALLKTQELEVREKAFDNGFYDTDGNHYICEHYVPYLKAMHTRGIMKGTSKSFKLKDYKQTWWLRKDKSE